MLYIAILRPFEPDCLHIFSLKRFWREYPDIDINKLASDLEYHTFNTTELNPAIKIELLDESLRNLCYEMINHAESFRKIRDANENELAKFLVKKI